MLQLSEKERIILLRMHIVKGWNNFQKSYEKVRQLFNETFKQKKNNVYQNSLSNVQSNDSNKMILLKTD